MSAPLLVVMANPGPYIEMVPIDKCFATGTVNEEKVWMMVRAYLKGERFKPVVGIQHPLKDRIAIADGHHRFHAYCVLQKLTGLKEIPVAISDDVAAYPFVAKGINQLNMTWQTKIRRGLRTARYKIARRKDDDWKC